MKKLLLATALLLPSLALAADLPTKAPSLLPAVTCTANSCTAWYLGAGIAGNGTNADILGGGITGSVFAGGGIPFADAGWQMWNGSVMLGAEVGGGYQLNTGSVANGVNTNETGYDFYQEVQFGGSLSTLFNIPSTTPPSGLTADIMAPYVAFGADERPWGTGWRTGAGIKFALPNTHAFLDIGYRYINYGSATIGTPLNGITISNDNLVFVKFNYAL